MPIKNLTDDTLTDRLPRLGKLRKGGEKTAKGYGPDLDHFRFTSDDPEIVAAFNAAYGQQPRELIIYLPYTNAEANFSSWCELWNASGLEHRCDSEYMSIWREGDKMCRGRKPCPGGHEKDDPKRDAVARLEFISPQLISVGYVGTITLETHSINDIITIAGVLKGIAAKRNGNLTGIAFRLWRQQEEISVPGFGAREGQRAKVKKWLVKIAPAAEWVRHELAQARANALTLHAPADVITGEVLSTTPVVERLEAPETATVRPALPAPRNVPQTPQPAPRSVPQARPAPQPARPPAPPKPVTVATVGKNNGAKPSKLQLYKDYWAKLSQWKIALGVEAEPLGPQDITEEKIKARGIELRSKLAYIARAGLLEAELATCENDDQIIELAVEMLEASHVTA